MKSINNITGLFFGSFNPIHNGHLMIANYMREFCNLNEIWFVVSPQNPLKQKSTLLDSYDRLHLVNLAIDNYSYFKACDIEFRLSNPSYTVNTLAHLKDKYPKREFAIIMGGDSLLTLPKWKNYDYILNNYSIFVYSRPNINSKNELFAHKNVNIPNVPSIEISSTFIRNSIKANKDIRFFLPQTVYKYILEMGFYV